MESTTRNKGRVTFIASDISCPYGSQYQLHLAMRDQEKYRAYQKEWRKRNRAKCVQYVLKSRAKTGYKGVPHTKEYCRNWRRNNPEKVKAAIRKWSAKPSSRQWFRDYEKRKRSTDVNFRLASVLRLRVRQVLRGRTKTDSTRGLLGCSIEDFKIYLESRFEVGMSWDNYGKIWEIDHIVPCSIFDLSRADHQKRCFHFSNQQPLTVTANRRKRAKTEIKLCY